MPRTAIHTPEQERRAREILARLADLRREEEELRDELFLLAYQPKPHTHVWKQTGGMNAGCGHDCHCSVPVHSCACGDCDYGMNPEAYFIKSECAEKRATEEQ